MLSSFQWNHFFILSLTCLKKMEKSEGVYFGRIRLKALNKQGQIVSLILYMGAEGMRWAKSARLSILPRDGISIVVVVSHKLIVSSVLLFTWSEY